MTRIYFENDAILEGEIAGNENPRGLPSSSYDARRRFPREIAQIKRATF